MSENHLTNYQSKKQKALHQAYISKLELTKCN